ncbi:MAG TPA: hypothetical protein VFV99_24110 [Kofleriaceae bacterium]|nr:hypothetical protein [Kofleriaceae bacterium]
MRIVIALVLAGLVASGCAFDGAQRSSRAKPNVPAECRADTARDVSIALFGLGMLGLGIASELQEPPLDAGNWLIVPGALLAITSTTSAIYGAVHGSTCQSAPPQQRSGSANAAAMR